MASVVSICNLALSNLGKENITDINEASAEGLACRQFYDHTRDMLLQSYPWRFASKVEALAEIANESGDRWAYAYARPADCLKVRALTDAARLDYLEYGPGVKAGGLDYGVEGPVIFCHASPAYLVYTQRLEDPSLYPPLFVDALSWHLAVRLAMPLTRDPKMRADAFQLATRMQAEAAVSDANEVRETSDFAAEAIEARA